MNEPIPPRTFEAVADPAQRPVYRRATVRVLVVDPGGQVLLLRDSDPNVPGLSWWMTPGGGIDPGESELEAGVRELTEETGLRIEARALRGPLARRRVVHGYSDRIVEQTDVFYLVTVAPFTVDMSGFTVEEQATMSEARWWPADDLAETDETIWPAELRALLALSEHDWPVQLPDAEESSVPV